MTRDQLTDWLRCLEGGMYDWVADEIKKKLAKPEQEAYGYAKRLAEFIWEKHYKKESPDWTPLPDVLGVLTQIDNMTCGLELAKPEQEPVAWMYKGNFHDFDPSEWASPEFVVTPLYTAPPKPEMPTKIFGPNLEQILNAAGFYRRVWVGLTDEEIKNIMQRWRNGYIDIKDVEQLLKEKNT
jgi:hypothetical protein